MTVYIYGLICPKRNALRYIGKALEVKVRFDLHISEARTGKRNSHKNQWIRSLLTQGLLPTVRILEIIENSDDSDWQHRERWWIQIARERGCPLTNLDAGGRGGNIKSENTKLLIRQKSLGRKLSQESIAKMKKTKRDRMTPELRKRLGDSKRGKKWSEVRKAAHSVASKGRQCSQETRDKIRNAQMGKYVSEETKAKIREARARQTNVKTDHLKSFGGRPPSEETRKRMSEAQKKRGPVSEETRAKQRLAKLGKKQSPEHIEKAHAALRGRKRSDEVRAKMSAAKKAGWARKKALLTKEMMSTI